MEDLAVTDFLFSLVSRGFLAFFYGYPEGYRTLQVLSSLIINVALIALMWSPLLAIYELYKFYVDPNITIFTVIISIRNTILEPAASIGMNPLSILSLLLGFLVLVPFFGMVLAFLTSPIWALIESFFRIEKGFFKIDSANVKRRVFF
jgi:hypothetical protein